MKRLKPACLLAAVLLCCLPCGCRNEEKDPVTVTVIHAWGGTEADHAAMRDIYEGFQEENPDVRLQLISMPTRTEMLRKVEDMIMVGDTLDIVTFSGMGQNRTYEFMVENDMALDLMPYLEEDPEFLGCLSQANLDYWVTEDNQLFTVADVLTLSGGYWYNEEIFEQAGVTEIPRTWDAFLEMCGQLRAWCGAQGQDVRPLQASGEGYLYFADHILAEQGAAIPEAAKNRRMSLSDGELAGVIGRLKDIYRASGSESTGYILPDEVSAPLGSMYHGMHLGDALPDEALPSRKDQNYGMPLGYTYLDETGLFNEGRLAIYVNGVWGSPMISRDIHAKYALLPTDSGAGISCESACLGYVLGRSGDEERQEASVRFLKYILSEPVQRRILKETEQIPASPHILLQDFKEEKPRLFQAAALVLDAEQKIDVPDNLWDASQKNEFTNHILEALSGGSSEQELAQRMK